MYAAGGWFGLRGGEGRRASGEGGGEGERPRAHRSGKRLTARATPRSVYTSSQLAHAAHRVSRASSYWRSAAEVVSDSDSCSRKGSGCMRMAVPSNLSASAYLEYGEIESVAIEWP
eukprot:scaffold24728_cov32-Tisochrysis_lutea.AAC.1